MKNTTLFRAIFICAILISPLAAESSDTPHMVNANEQIQNLDTVLAQLKQESDVPVLFPYQIPKPEEGKKYFANRDAVAAKNGYSYWLNVDYTPDCNGIKACNVGNMTARRNASFEKFTDMQNKILTSEVALTKGIKGYFTPGHPMGDYFPANIQWMNNGVLYSLMWAAVPRSPDEERTLLIAMANSAIIGAGSVASKGSPSNNPLGY